MNLNSGILEFIIKNVKRALILFGIVILLLTGFQSAKKEYHLYQYPEYTFGTIDSIQFDEQKDKTAFYSFYAKSHIWNGKAHFDYKSPQKVGQQIRVKYSSRNPTYNRIQR